MSTVHTHEVETGKRFRFGRNWQLFLRTVDQTRIDESKNALTTMLAPQTLEGATFLDIGCGSGLSSLAASQLGARVHSFDFDPLSVECTRELKRRFAPDQSDWQIESGSVLDKEYIRGLGQFDVVYSWGVLHHTGDLKSALENAIDAVAADGRLMIAIYNDQGFRSRLWRHVKKAYCGSTIGRAAVLATFIPYFVLRAIAVGTIKYYRPWGEFTRYKSNRGMSIVHDWIDWLGGYPFEVAKPHELQESVCDAGFEHVRSKLTRRLGCNEFVFRRLVNEEHLSHSN